MLAVIWTGPSPNEVYPSSVPVLSSNITLAKKASVCCAAASSSSSQSGSRFVMAGADDMAFAVISRGSHSRPRILVETGGLVKTGSRSHSRCKAGCVAGHKFAIARRMCVLGAVGVAIELWFIRGLFPIGSVLFVFVGLALAFSFAIFALLDW
jgi:hypothetical protein